jgi:hypothetical protein
MARQPVKNRGVGPLTAVMDTSGVDHPEDLIGMRGAAGAGSPAGDSTHVGSPPKSTDGFSKFMSGISGMFKSRPKPAAPDTMSSATEDSLSKKYLGK